MTIISRNTGLSMKLKGMATDIVATPKNKLKGIVIEDTSEKYGAVSCCELNLVCADANSNDLDKNDSTALFFELSTKNDSFSIDLWKDGVFATHLTNTDYGVLYLPNTINYYPNQNALCGFVIDWKKVLLAFGIGQYKCVINIEGENYNSLKYDLRQWSDSIVEGYICVESYMNGYLLRPQMNFKGLNIRDCARFKGFFGLVQPENVVTKDLFTSNNGNSREVVTRKTIKVDVFQLFLKPIYECYADRLINYHLFGNEIYITDNNSNNYSYDYVRVKVVSEEAPKLTFLQANRKVIIEVRLKEAIQDNQKTNYF